jgi:RNA polymerase sigma factor (sigma-70 family)
MKKPPLLTFNYGRDTFRSLSVSEMFASLLRALGNWDAAQYLWRRHRVLQKPRLPMTQTIRERTLNRNPPPRATFDESIWQYRRRLLCMARRILRDEADAEDAVQDAYVSALTHSEQFEGRSSPLTWITRILINQALSQLRAKPRQPLAIAVGFDEAESCSSISYSENPEEYVSREQLSNALRAALKQVPEKFRVVIDLREFRGMSIAETARQLSLTEACIKTRLHRGHHLLRKESHARLPYVQHRRDHLQRSELSSRAAAADL